MSDERLRQLERAAAAGDPEAQARLAAARRRSLDLEAVSELLRDDPEKTLKALLRPLDEDELRRVQECVSREAQRREHPPREHIRLRPAMYVGGAFERGLHESLFVVVCASIDAAIAGTVSRIEVTLDGTQATVWDDLPRAPGLLEEDLLAFDVITEGRYAYQSNLVGLGLCVSNALSARFDVETVEPGEEGYRLSFEAGRRVERDIAVTASPGTRFTLQADPTVFRTTLFSFDRVRARLQALAYLVPGLRISIEDVRAGRQANFLTRGLVDSVAELCPPKEALTPTLVCAGFEDIGSAGGEVRIEAALAWRRSSEEQLVVGYANTNLMTDGGSHVRGLREGIAHVLPGGGRRGLVAVVSVLVPRPTWLGASSQQLGDPAIGAAVRAVVEPALRTWLDDHPQAAEALRGR